jgi:hypothetical protein
MELPAATVEQVRSLCRKKHDEIQLITFGDGANNSIKGLQLAAQVSCGELDTVITPMDLFDWRDILPHESVGDGNERASMALKDIMGNVLSSPYLTGIYSALNLALQRLITENRHQRRIK